MNKEETDKLIDRYINNEMSREERKEFKSRLDQDESLNEKVCLAALLTETGRRHQEQPLLDELKSLSEEDIKRILSQPTAQKETLRRLLAVASCAALLLGFFLLGNTYKYTPSYISTTCHISAPVIEYARGGNGQTPLEIKISEETLSAYEQNDYAQVVRIYSNTHKDSDPINPKNDSYYIAVAYSLIKTGNIKEAVPVLNMLANGKSVYEEESQWLLLYIYLEMSDRKKAIETAQKIIDKNGIYSGQAKDMQKQLTEKRWF